jgi:hypothetical protein
MRFSTSAITSIAIVANSAYLGEGRRKLLDSKLAHKRRETSRSLFSNTKPMWEDMKGPSSDQHASVPDVEHECDLDVGILGCGKDQACVPSSRSKRGGVCQSKLWEHNSRELQGNITTPTDYLAQEYYSLLCQDQDSYLSCDCTKFDNATFAGEISCTYPTWCDDVDDTLCGSLAYTFYMESGSVTLSNCVEVSAERFCYSLDVTNDNSTNKCLSSSMNGCECGCEYTPNGCSMDDVNSVLISCPDNVNWDGCSGLGSLFGNKLASCDSPPQSNTTSAPSKSPKGGAPVGVETDEPGVSPAENTSPPTSSSSMHFKKSFQVASVVTSMTVLLSYWV